MGVLIFMLGAILGSFYNVVAIRTSLGFEYIKTPSACMECGQRLKPHELIPIISFVAQKGKCRHCGIKLTKGYLYGELATATSFLIIYLMEGLTYTSLSYMVLISLMIVGAKFEKYGKTFNKRTLTLVALALLFIQFIAGEIEGGVLLTTYLVIYSLLFMLITKTNKTKPQEGEIIKAIILTNLVQQGESVLITIIVAFVLGLLIGIKHKTLRLFSTLHLAVLLVLTVSELI